jgi:hypothetical protein
MRIRFLTTQIYESAPGKGPTFEAGSILASDEVREKLGLQQEPTEEWLQAFMNRWLQRGVAVDADAEDNAEVGPDDTPAPEQEPEDDGVVDLSTLTRAELDALALERGVDISEAKNKGDVIAALELAAETAE